MRWRLLLRRSPSAWSSPLAVLAAALAVELERCGHQFAADADRNLGHLETQVRQPPREVQRQALESAAQARTSALPAH